MSNPPDFEKFMLKAMREGWLIVLLKPGGNGLICRDVELCSDDDFRNQLTEQEVLIWLERHR